MSFRVWAPFARSVQLRVGPPGAADLPMQRDDRGWWHATVDPPGAHRVVVDGTAIPDPRSGCQPDGVDGPSVRVDHGAFAWTDERWRTPPWGDRILYELHVGTFTPGGTFFTAIERLDHLVDLGIDTVEVMPVNTFPGRHGWGYDGVLLGATHHAYGGPDGLKAFVDACHARGLAVVLDVVYNHLGPYGNHLARLGPYFDGSHTTPWGPAVNLEGAGSDEVRAFFIDNAVSWIVDFHLDGLRVDAVHAFVDRTAIPFLEELTTSVHVAAQRAGRRAWVIAESDLNDPRVVRPPAVGGLGFDAMWSDDVHHALHALLTGERDGYYADFGGIDALATALATGFVHQGEYVSHRGRRHGRPPVGVEPSRFVAYTQTHDQVGNRAGGERLAALTSRRRLEIAAAVVLLGPFTPMLFQGEEWGASTPFLYFTDHPDEDLAAAVREGRRAEFASFGPEDLHDPQDLDTYRRSVLRWEERTRPPHDGLLAWYRACIAERRGAQASGRFGRRAVVVGDGEPWLVLDMDAIVVVIDLGATGASVPVPDDSVLAFANDERVRVVDGRLRSAPDSVAVLRRTPLA